MQRRLALAFWRCIACCGDACHQLCPALDSLDHQGRNIFSAQFSLNAAAHKGVPSAQIMSCLIEEGDDVPQQLLDIILGGLLDENARASRSACAFPV